MFVADAPDKSGVHLIWEKVLRLESVRSLKAELFNSLLRTELTHPTPGRLGPFSVGSFASAPRVALGVYRRGLGRDYGLALRIQDEGDALVPFLEQVGEAAHGEISVRFIGAVTPLSGSTPPWHHSRLRPLRMGSSIGHTSITAGTLGAFVRDRYTGDNLVLSNNHVLAAEDTASHMDAIVQPGPTDSGSDPADTVARLLRSHPLVTSGNLVDAAVATLDDGQSFRPRMLPGRLRLAGRRMTDVDVGDAVFKVGRTTGPTKGRVTAIELDALIVDYGQGQLAFDGQIEIEGFGSRAFSRSGDSGSVIFDANLQACGLLFAGGTSGGSNGLGLTYANPMGQVLDLLQVDLI